jgi:hypothetical protein
LLLSWIIHIMAWILYSSSCRGRASAHWRGTSRSEFSTPHRWLICGRLKSNSLKNHAGIIWTLFGQSLRTIIIIPLCYLTIFIKLLDNTVCEPSSDCNEIKHSTQSYRVTVITGVLQKVGSEWKCHKDHQNNIQPTD